MKKLIFVLALLMALTPLVWAQDAEQDRGPEEGGGMMGKGKMGMMGGMMQKDSVVATSDGGVVVKQGPKLIKYDSQLNLVKEVELPRGKKPTEDHSEHAAHTGSES